MVMEMIEKDPPYMGQPPTRVLFNILKKGLPELKVIFSLVMSFFLIFFQWDEELNCVFLLVIILLQNPGASSNEIKDFIAQCTQVDLSSIFLAK